MKHICKKCNEQFSSPIELDDHTKNVDHSGMTSIVPKQVNKLLNQLNALSKSQPASEPIKETKLLRDVDGCPYCGKTTNNNKSYDIVFDRKNKKWHYNCSKQNDSQFEGFTDAEREEKNRKTQEDFEKLEEILAKRDLKPNRITYRMPPKMVPELIGTIADAAGINLHYVYHKNGSYLQFMKEKSIESFISMAEQYIKEYAVDEDSENDVLKKVIIYLSDKNNQIDISKQARNMRRLLIKYF